MKRNDKDAIDAAARAFARARQAVYDANNVKQPEGGYWPGTRYIEAAVDAYLQARGIGDTGSVRAPAPQTYADPLLSSVGRTILVAEKINGVVLLVFTDGTRLKLSST